jgi:hypothetical protein
MGNSTGFRIGKPSRRLLLVTVLVTLSVGAYVRVADAWSVCVDTYVGSCLSSSGCDFYDDATDAPRGSIRVFYHCPITY